MLDTYVYNNGVLGGDWGVSAAAGLVKGVVGVAAGARRQQGRPPLRRARGVREMTTMEQSTIGTTRSPQRRRERQAAAVDGEAATRSPRWSSPWRWSSACALVIIPFWSVISTIASPTRQTINDSGGGWCCGPTGVTFSALQAVLPAAWSPGPCWSRIGITVVGTLLSAWPATAVLAYGSRRPSARSGASRS